MERNKTREELETVSKNRLLFSALETLPHPQSKPPGGGPAYSPMQRVRVEALMAEGLLESKDEEGDLTLTDEGLVHLHNLITDHLRIRKILET